FATAGTVARLGARPLFADIDPTTYNLSPASVEDLIRTSCETRAGRLVNRKTGGRVKVLMPVHLFGQVAEMDALMELERRDDLREHLRRAEIGTEIYYPVPLHLQECFAFLGGKPEDCPVSVRAAKETLALPIYPELTADQQRHVVRTIAEFYEPGH